MGRAAYTQTVPHEAWARSELQRRGWDPDDVEAILREFAEDVREFGPGARSLSLLTAEGIHRHRAREASRG